MIRGTAPCILNASSYDSITPSNSLLTLSSCNRSRFSDCSRSSCLR